MGEASVMGCRSNNESDVLDCGEQIIVLGPSMKNEAERHPQDQEDETWAVPQKLKPSQSRLITFLAVTGVCIFWNGLVSVFVFKIFSLNAFDWSHVLFGLFLIPFVLVGVGLMLVVVYLFLGLFNPKVVIATSSGAVPMGGEVDIAWEVVGNAGRIKRLRISLHGEQYATYQRGTTTTTDKELFEVIPVFEATTPSDIEFGSATVRIPEATMHTFEAPRNKIVWSIVVSGDIPWWPDVNESFPIRVKPSF